MPAGLQQQSVLGICGAAFHRGHLEKSGIKLSDILCQEVGLTNVAAPWLAWRRRIEGIRVPAFARNGSHCGAPGAQQIPVALRALRASGKAAPHANDGDRLSLVHVPRCVQFGAELPDRHDRLLEQFLGVEAHACPSSFVAASISRHSNSAKSSSSRSSSAISSVSLATTARSSE